MIFGQKVQNNLPEKHKKYQTGSLQLPEILEHVYVDRRSYTSLSRLADHFLNNKTKIKCLTRNFKFFALDLILTRDLKIFQLDR